jgi:hypothetical protein
MYRTTRSFNVGQNMNEDAFFGMDEAMSEAVFSSDLPEEARASSPVLGEKDPKLVALGSEDLASDDDDDGEWVPEETRRKTRCTDEEKALEVLDSLPDRTWAYVLAFKHNVGYLHLEWVKCHTRR